MAVRAGQGIFEYVTFQELVYKLLVSKPDSFFSRVFLLVHACFFFPPDSKYLLNAYHGRN